MKLWVIQDEFVTSIPHKKTIEIHLKIEVMHVAT